MYGPNNRRDMACFTFTDTIAQGRKIHLFGKNTKRDFTYIDDVIEGVSRIINLPSINSDVPYRVYN